jgi:4-hydroxybenzoate polyprenyltransferase
MVKNIFKSITKEIGLKETAYFKVFLILLYVSLILLILPIGLAFLKSLVGLAMFIIYFLPYLIANSKGHPSEKSMFWLNLFLAWTIIAWIILLIIVVSYSKPKSKKKNTKK